MPKIKYPENIQKLIEQLETGNNLIDYFFVCGYEPENCLDSTLYDSSNNSSNNYLEHLNTIIKPSIFCKFPEFDNNNDTIDDSIISYCFPHGFKVIFSNNFQKQPEIFSIILDNNLFSSEFPQKYLTCLLFYEKLSDYAKLKQKYEEIKNQQDDGKNILDEKIKHFGRGHDNDSGKKKREFTHKRNVKTEIDLMGKFELMKPEERKTVFEPINLNKYKNYYVPKCICLVSIHPYVKLYQQIIKNIFDYKCDNNPKTIPLEKIITNLIIEVPIPPRGLYSIYYNYSFDELIKPTLDNKSDRYSKIENNSQSKSITPQPKTAISPLQSTEKNKILVSEMKLQQFNSTLSFNCILETIKHILFDSKILFFSKNLNILTETILSFLSLLFPFKYPFQVSSLLHKTDYGILESTSPFIIGIKENFEPNFFEENNIVLDGLNILVVDLNKKECKLFSDETFPEFPNKSVSNLEKEIKALEVIFSCSDSIKDAKEFNEQYQEKFFHFYCEILKGYEDCLNMDFFKSNDDDHFTSVETLFNCEQFIKTNHSQSDIPFYTKFIKDGQLFADFIYKRMIPRNNNELMDILIVNDYLSLYKKKAKVKGKDNLQNEYQINNKYIVDGPREVTEEEKNNLLPKKLNLCENSIIITEVKHPGSGSDLLFEYILFPKLEFQIYCHNDNVNQYIPPPDYSEEIDAISSDVISKSSLGQNMNRTMEMKNYIYLTWLEIWAFTLHCNEQQELHYRFDQMLDVLDKVIHHEMNIFNLMFDALNKYGQPEMMLKLYQKLLQLKLNPSGYIYDIISNILDKKQIKNLLEEMKKNSSKKLKFADYNIRNIKNNRKRTFLSVDDNLALETKPKFYYDYNCISCLEKINLYSICKNFEGIRNDILWVKCKKCGEYNLPKIQVKFGLDMITTNNRFSSIEDFVLHSPYNLKINMKSAVVNHYGKEINISNFKSQFQALFWNFIWYCVVQNLDFNIILPYCNNLEILREINCYNPNRAIFDVRYDNDLFEENQKKIKIISSGQKHSETRKKLKFDNLTICSAVAKIILNVIEKQNSNIEKKENTEDNGEKNSSKKKTIIDEVKEEKEDEKKEDDNAEDDEQKIKDFEEQSKALFPQTWGN